MISLAWHVWTFGWLGTVPTPVLIVAGVAAWLAVAFGVAALLGHVIHGRDRQIPREQTEPGGLIPVPEVDEREEEVQR